MIMESISTFYKNSLCQIYIFEMFRPVSVYIWFDLYLYCTYTQNVPFFIFGQNFGNVDIKHMSFHDKYLNHFMGDPCQKSEYHTFLKLIGDLFQNVTQSSIAFYPPIHSYFATYSQSIDDRILIADHFRSDHDLS